MVIERISQKKNTQRAIVTLKGKRPDNGELGGKKSSHYNVVKKLNLSRGNMNFLESYVAIAHL